MRTRNTTRCIINFFGSKQSEKREGLETNSQTCIDIASTEDGPGGRINISGPGWIDLNHLAGIQPSSNRHQKHAKGSGK